MADTWKLTDEQSDLLERFYAAYNSIDRHLRKLLGSDKAVPFTRLVKAFDEKYRLGEDGDYLRMVADLRNVLIHQKTTPRHDLAIPTAPVVERLQAIHVRLIEQPLVVPKFQRQVETLTVETSLAAVLNLIAKRDYSQFPVYAGSAFRGLLTENGITRWLAHHVSKQASAVDLEHVLVKKVLPEEEKRPNCVFVSRTATVNRIVTLFGERELLEAVLITESGKGSELLLGIITRWDVIHEK